ncbi:hypothetical protein DS909_06970 [Phaeobacter gallaeciensis]|uniref:Uncharacterized protein n=2 Tax=Roseobacteraceae TaxID=2854170 RepID=A0A366X1M9_9RHOB|nr:MULTISPECIES: hypothetical protein [Roseobacteraceae]MBT3139508.1 hypothetical protein [Falsiruegeria litorea]MBT8168351.1 hypothetical protein [Falsiruegeria litorea]RBW58343.1 hypothetical protein DS909_06970 [Phaeobacter gallaeciensis]
MNNTETQAATLDPAALSWAAPGSSDSFAMYGLITLLLIVFLVIYLYAAFDRYAESKGEASPLRTTIPTMLTVGLAYDLLPPLEGVNFLLPLSLIAAALTRDAVLWKSESRGR